MSTLISSILWEHLLPMQFCCFVADISAVNFNLKHEAPKLRVCVCQLLGFIFTHYLRDLGLMRFSCQYCWKCQWLYSV